MEESNQQPNQEGGQPMGQESKEQEPQQQEAPQQDASQQEKTEQNAGQQETPPASGNDVEENKAIAYLSYLGILFLIPMLVKRESAFAQFHAKQGLVLTIGWFLGSFLVPVFGLGVLVYLAILVFSVMGLVNVNKGEMKDLPIVGDIAKKFNF